MSKSEKSKKYSRGVYFLFGLGIAVLAVGFNTLNQYWSVSGLALTILSFFAIFATRIADIAHDKGKSWEAFFWLSLLVSPLITWLIVASIKSERTSAEQSQSPSVSEEIRKLEALYKSGALDEEEYKKAKAKILGI